MTLIEMAKEYRENATMLKERIGELKKELKHTDHALKRKRLQARILCYESVYADNMSTARYMENYYRGGEECH